MPIKMKGSYHPRDTMRDAIFVAFCSQQIRFGLQTPQEIVKCGAFHAYERALYKVSSAVQRVSCSFPVTPTQAASAAAAWQAYDGRHMMAGI